MSNPIDEDFDYFLEKMGPAFDRRYAPPSTINRYRNRLPDQLLRYWEEHGWCGYADGLFWTVDPGVFAPAVDAWLGDTPFVQADAYHVIARTAFGDLYLWGEKTGFSLQIVALGSFAVPRMSSKMSADKRAQIFFGTRNRDNEDFDEMFAPALAKLGRLNADEMYGFVPALSLGGADTLDHLQKVKAVEHLVFLAQLSDLNVMKTAPL